VDETARAKERDRDRDKDGILFIDEMATEKAKHKKKHKTFISRVGRQLID
jgi:hypothetical protein